MLVRELVALLKEADQDLPVMVFDEQTVTYLPLEGGDVRAGGLVASMRIEGQFEEAIESRPDMSALLIL